MSNYTISDDGSVIMKFKNEDLKNIIKISKKAEKKAEKMK